MRLRATSAVICAVALFAPAVARAADGDAVTDPAVSQYMRIAADFWGQAPHCSGPNGEPIGAYAVYGYNPNLFIAAWSETPGCRITLNTRQWPAEPNEPQCNVIAHEWGHLLGHEHSPDPTNLMFEGQVPLAVPGCRVFRETEPADDADESPATLPVQKLARHVKSRKRHTRCARAQRKRVRHGAKRKLRKSCSKKPVRRRHRRRR